MKKIVLAVAAAMMVAGAAYAGGSNAGTLEVGVTYGNIGAINKSNSQNHTDFGGWGFMVGYYEPIIPFLGVQANGFMVFPGTDGVSVTTNGTTANMGSVLKVPFAVSGELMLALDIPIAIFDIRAGVGLGYTLYDAQPVIGNESYIHQFSVPIFVAAGVQLGSFGVKAGCDVQFVFSQYQTIDNKTDTYSNSNLDFINVFPYVAATFKF